MLSVAQRTNRIRLNGSARQHILTRTDQKPMPFSITLIMIEFKEIFEHRNRGLLLDVTVFLFQLILIRLLTTLSLGFVSQAEENAFAKAVIGLFLA